MFETGSNEEFPLWLRRNEPNSHPGGLGFDSWRHSVGSAFCIAVSCDVGHRRGSNLDPSLGTSTGHKCGPKKQKKKKKEREREREKRKKETGSSK